MSCVISHRRYTDVVTSKKGVNGIGVPKNHCDISRSTPAVPAAFEFVPSVYGGSDGRAQALPVHASGSRYANLSELPPSIGVEDGGFSKPNLLGANHGYLFAHCCAHLAHHGHA